MVVKLEDIGLTIGRQEIVKEINLELKKGQIITLIGPNGGGKTSIARILLGIIKPSQGMVLKEPKIKIGYMPQRISIDKTIPLSAKNFLELTTKNTAPYSDIRSLILRLDLEKILSRQIQDLSSGQIQKILFLRALINQPDLLVLDEPTQYMDIAAIDDFYLVIDEIRKSSNCAILLISHDLHTVMQKTDFVFCINRHICCHGAPELVNQHPEYLSLFGRKDGLTIYQHRHDHDHKY